MSSPPKVRQARRAANASATTAPARPGSTSGSVPAWLDWQNETTRTFITIAVVGLIVWFFLTRTD